MPRWVFHQPVHVLCNRGHFATKDQAAASHSCGFFSRRCTPVDSSRKGSPSFPACLSLRTKTQYTLPALALFDATYPFYMFAYCSLFSLNTLGPVCASLFFPTPTGNQQCCSCHANKRVCPVEQPLGSGKLAAPGCVWKWKWGFRGTIGYPMVSVPHVQTNPHLDFVVCWWRGNNFHKDPNRKWLAASNRFIRHGLWKEGGKWIVYIPWISATFGDYDRQSGHL